MERTACCSVSKNANDSTIIGSVEAENSFRARLRADMLEVVKEQQHQIHDWAVQWEKERTMNIEQYMRTITGMIDQLQAELTAKAEITNKAGSPSRPSRVGFSELSPGVDGQTDYLENTNASSNLLRFAEPDRAPTEDKQREQSAGTLTPSATARLNKNNHEFVRHFMTDKVRTGTTQVFEDTPTEKNDTPASGLSIHLSRLQKNSGKYSRKKKADRLSSTNEEEQTTKFLLQRLVDSRVFTTSVAFFIFANTVFTAVEVDMNMNNALSSPQKSNPAFFKTVNLVFTVIFAVELLVRFAAYRCELFTSDDMYWNAWDVIVVASSIIEELVAGVSMSALRSLRVLRLVRTLRIIRVVRFFRQLRLMVCCILNGIMQLAWALVLLVLLMSLFSIVCVQAAATHLREETGNGLEESKADELSPADMRSAVELNYPSIWRASMSMLMSVSGGCDWYEVMVPLLNISHLYALLFVLFVVFVVFGVLNVLTGIFVEQALQVRDRDLIVQAEMENIDRFLVDMQDIFMEADVDVSGMLTKKELDKFLNQDRVLAYMSTHGLDVSDMSAMFRLLDQDDTGVIEMDEWLLGCLRLKGHAKCLDIMRLVECVDVVYTMMKETQKMIGVLAVPRAV